MEEDSISIIFQYSTHINQKEKKEEKKKKKMIENAPHDQDFKWEKNSKVSMKSINKWYLDNEKNPACLIFYCRWKAIRWRVLLRVTLVIANVNYIRKNGAWDKKLIMKKIRGFGFRKKKVVHQLYYRLWNTFKK